jgi:uncharacterized integral membrane protein
MIRIVVSVVLLVLVAVLMAFNIGSTTSLSLFGARFDTVPTMALALVSFALGVVYSLFLYASRYLHRRKRQNVERKDKALTQREQELSARETAATRDATAGADSPQGMDRTGLKAPTVSEYGRPRFFDRLRKRR